MNDLEFCKGGNLPMIRECPDCIDKYVSLAESYQTRCKELEREIDKQDGKERKLLLQIHELRSAVLKYGSHLDGCKIHCSCGLGEVLKTEKRLCVACKSQPMLYSERCEACYGKMAGEPFKRKDATPAIDCICGPNFQEHLTSCALYVSKRAYPSDFTKIEPGAKFGPPQCICQGFFRMPTCPIHH